MQVEGNVVQRGLRRFVADGWGERNICNRQRLDRRNRLAFEKLGSVGAARHPFDNPLAGNLRSRSFADDPA